MKSIKYSIITMAALAVGTIGSYAVSASSETYVGLATNISAEPITLEDAAALTKTAHGTSRLRAYPVCNNCRFVRCDRSKFCSGHCRTGRRLHFCSTDNFNTP